MLKPKDSAIRQIFIPITGATTAQLTTNNNTNYWAAKLRPHVVTPVVKQPAKFVTPQPADNNSWAARLGSSTQTPLVLTEKVNSDSWDTANKFLEKTEGSHQLAPHEQHPIKNLLVSAQKPSLDSSGTSKAKPFENNKIEPKSSNKAVKQLLPRGDQSKLLSSQKPNSNASNTTDVKPLEKNESKHPALQMPPQTIFGIFPVNKNEVTNVDYFQRNLLPPALLKIAGKIRKLVPDCVIYLQGDANANILHKFKSYWSLNLCIVIKKGSDKGIIEFFNYLKNSPAVRTYKSENHPNDKNHCEFICANKDDDLNFNVEFVEEIPGKTADEMMNESILASAFNAQSLYTCISDNTTLVMKGCLNSFRPLLRKQIVPLQKELTFVNLLELIEYHLRFNIPFDNSPFRHLFNESSLCVAFNKMVHNLYSAKGLIVVLCGLYSYDKNTDLLQQINICGVFKALTGLEMEIFKDTLRHLIPFMNVSEHITKVMYLWLFLIAHRCMNDPKAFRDNKNFIEELPLVKVLKSIGIELDEYLAYLKAWVAGEVPKHSDVHQNYNFRTMLDNIKAYHQSRIEAQVGAGMSMN